MDTSPYSLKYNLLTSGNRIILLHKMCHNKSHSFVQEHEHCSTKLADNTTHTVPMQSISRKNELTISHYICVQCVELKNQLKETVEELKSARLIIDLLQQKSSTRITSNHHDVNRNNIRGLEL
jgi:hypothetical protein